MDKDESDTEMSQLIKINEKLGKLIELSVESKKEQVITNNLLCALCNSNDLIVTYKEEQKQGDKKSRKRAELYSKISIGIASVGLWVASAALYIVVTGQSGVFVRFIVGLFKGLL